MKYQVLTRNRSVISLQEAEHQAAVLDAKQDLERIQQAVREWRNKKDVNTDNVDDTGRDNGTTDPYTNSDQIGATTKTSRSNSQNNLSWTDGKEFRPLMIPEINSQSIRKCFSEFKLCVDREVGTGVSVGDIFQEASLLLRKGSSNTNAAANMMRYLKPLGAETKHYTTPNQSAKNSPRDNLVWQQMQEKRADQGDGRRVQQQATTPVSQDELNSPNTSQSNIEGDTPRQRCEQKDANDDIDQIGSMPYCHGRCGIVEVLPTIMEKVSPTASSSQRSFATSSGSDDSLKRKNAIIKVKKGANTAALAKCSLCERFGSDSQIIFSIDNVKYTFSKNGQNRLEPYTGGGSVKKTVSANDDKMRQIHTGKPSNVVSSATPYVKYENKNTHLPPINSNPGNSNTISETNLVKQKHPPRVFLPLLTPKEYPVDRKLRLSDACRADNKRLPPIPSHVVLKRKNKKPKTQRGEMLTTHSNLLFGCKLPPLKLPEVCGHGKSSIPQKYQGYQSPFNESIRNNSRCEQTERTNEACDTGTMTTGVDHMTDNTEEPFHLLVKIPTMETSFLDEPRTPRKRKVSKRSKTGKH
ncbi:uncharacterized protein LOC132562211 [Ylistrum balloti]|uniref:uncharacterized protein LOC132562211 n=1 Tax=Ylistrum balloti TaxID=509963 RepID=UPI002905A334|nr:uncharacterized protein LOC132562211 [Ylistrum balloti]